MAVVVAVAEGVNVTVDVVIAVGVALGEGVAVAVAVAVGVAVGVADEDVRSSNTVTSLDRAEHVKGLYSGAVVFASSAVTVTFSAGWNMLSDTNVTSTRALRSIQLLLSNISWEGVMDSTRMDEDEIFNVTTPCGSEVKA